MWKEFRVAVSFLTTLPLKYKGEWDEKTFSRASIFYPLVGLIVGLISGAVIYVLSITEYWHIAAFAGLVTSIILSGGLHLDGFMDMCDGLLASRGPERALEIMKDSRVGSFSVIGMIILLLSKFLLYDALVVSGNYFFAIVAALTFSRFILICCLLLYPCARETGLGVTVKKYVSKKALIFGTVLMVLLMVISRDIAIVTAFVLALALILAITQSISKFLGGITGDVMGAM
ncbi:MAG: adenosylcobinamide-GDP ribazoletransferase, partial [Bacillota bacterium]|nr:adenosylcobinamide-GDP ribazoletransferase [Bacillota bacterium]